MGFVFPPLPPRPSLRRGAISTPRRPSSNLQAPARPAIGVRVPGVSKVQPVLVPAEPRQHVVHDPQGGLDEDHAAQMKDRSSMKAHPLWTLRRHHSPWRFQSHGTRSVPHVYSARSGTVPISCQST
jgi:hypothetical protein